VGSVLVGSKTSPVKVASLSSGRLYEKVIHEALGLVDLNIYSAREKGIEPLYTKITGPVLYHTLTHRAWSLFNCWTEAEARERLVPELVRPEKARSISKPTALEWHAIKMPADCDCRGVLDELVNMEIKLNGEFKGVHSHIDPNSGIDAQPQGACA
jgi:hypothetical protein